MKLSLVLLFAILSLSLGAILPFHPAVNNSKVARADTTVGWTVGRSTHYNSPDAGECGYGYQSPSTFPYRHIAAANTAAYSGSGLCGYCYEIMCVKDWYDNTIPCTGQTVRVQVTDECPVVGNEMWCSGDIVHFDLSEEAFSVLADLNSGVIQTQYRQISCDAQGTLQMSIGSGSSQYWISMSPQNSAGAGGIANVQLGYNGAYVNLARQQYNYWVLQTEWGAPPIAFPTYAIVTSISGEQIAVYLTSPNPGVYDSGQQFSYNNADSVFFDVLVFDVWQYLSIYADLQAAFGSNIDAAMDHWLSNGIWEGRQATYTFAVDEYKWLYPDIAPLGNDQAVAHFPSYGFNEGRVGRIILSPLAFNWQWYLSYNTDLSPIIGWSITAAQSHWVTSGVYEGRQAAPNFNVNEYKAINSDIAYMDNYDAVVHWVAYGYNEGRQGVY